MSAALNGSSWRLAAIDVGTNSIRLVVAEAAHDGSYAVLDDEKVVARLGAGLATSGRLSPQAMEDSADAVAQLRAIAEGYGVEEVRAVATCAVREAVTGAEMVRLVKDRAGLDLVVLRGEEEGRLAYRSVAAAFDLSSINAAVVDIGGGSTEVVIAVDGVVEQIHSLPLGAVRLSERFGPCDDPGRDGFKVLRRHVRETIERHVTGPGVVPQLVLGTGGTFTSLAAMLMHRELRGAPGAVLPFASRGYETKRDEVRHLLQALRKTPVEGRLSIPGLSPDRADIIVAGIAIIDALMRHMDVNRLRVHDQGIRDGLLLTMIDERRGADPGVPPARVSRVRSAAAFAARCKFDEPHARQVSRLALELFDQVGTQLGWKRSHPSTLEQRELLHVAALVHDVGYLINYAAHHKHSYHLIVHSDMPGFTRRELDVVAAVARYHRKAEPGADHPEFAKLSGKDRGLVRRLASILRIADGLDRAHAGHVAGVCVHVVDDVAIFRVQADAEPRVDLWGAQRKSGLFERVFDLRARFAWEPAGVLVEPRSPALRLADPGSLLPEFERMERAPEA